MICLFCLRIGTCVQPSCWFQSSCLLLHLKNKVSPFVVQSNKSHWRGQKLKGFIKGCCVTTIGQERGDSFVSMKMTLATWSEKKIEVLPGIARYSSLFRDGEESVFLRLKLSEGTKLTSVLWPKDTRLMKCLGMCLENKLYSKWKYSKKLEIFLIRGDMLSE
jgi:hypothetical protein